MPNYTITIPADKATAVVESFCKTYNYQEQVIDESGTLVPNPITKAQFVKSKIREYIKSVYVEYQANIVEDQKNQALIASQTALDSITVN